MEQHFVYIQLACGVMQFSGNNFVYLRVFVYIWSDGLQQQLFGILLTIAEAYFTNQPFRKRGRPQVRWDDNLRKFGEMQFQQKTWSIPARHTSLWRSFENEYVQFCRETIAL